MNENTKKRGRPSEVDKLKGRIEEMQKQQENLMEKFGALLEILQNQPLYNKKEDIKENKVIEEEKNEESESYEVFEQPKSDELIKICSLTHGELNLNLDGRIAISFRKYGDIKPVLYSQLVNIVNENRSFAECGDFYIMDKRAVYHLGLFEYYKRIYPLEVLNNIENYDNSKIEKILSNMCRAQKESVIINIARKLYNEENINQNSVKFIENILNVDIHDMVKTMREIDSNLE